MPFEGFGLERNARLRRSFTARHRAVPPAVNPNARSVKEVTIR
jgi:hypothetical protein